MNSDVTSPNEPSASTPPASNFMPLLQLDPSPMGTPPPVPTDTNEEIEDVIAPQDQAVVAGHSVPSPVTGPGAIFYFSRIQRFSSYAVGLFTSLHLANVSLIPAVTRSVPGSENYLLMTREIYQTSLTEPILVALPVLAHVGSGIALRWLRRSQNARRYGSNAAPVHDKSSVATASSSLWPPVSYISMSGYAFTVFYAAHVFMNRILPLEVEGDSSNIGLAYVAHGFARHPAVAWTAYSALIIVGCGHMIWGQAKWLGLAPSTNMLRGVGSVALSKEAQQHRKRRWLGLHGAAAAFAGLWAVGGLAVVATGGPTDGWIGKVYDGMFEAVGL